MEYSNSLEYAQQQDKEDKISYLRNQFHIPFSRTPALALAMVFCVVSNDDVPLTTNAAECPIRSAHPAMDKKTDMLTLFTSFILSLASVCTAVRTSSTAWSAYSMYIV